MNVTETLQTQQSQKELMVLTPKASVHPFTSSVSGNSITIHPGLYARILGVIENPFLLFLTYNWSPKPEGYTQSHPLMTY